MFRIINPSSGAWAAACSLSYFMLTAFVVSGFSLPVAHAVVEDQDQVIVATRRITETQYKNTIFSIFGREAPINGLFEPEERLELLLALGSAELSISSAGFNQYFNMARGIASYAVDEKNRQRYFSCGLDTSSAFDEACARSIINHYGRLLFRRPLIENEIAPRLELVSSAVSNTNNFYRGIELALVSLMSSPEFLFRIEVAERDPDNLNSYRLDAFTKVARLSHLFWDVSPDEELMRVAESGEIHNHKVVDQQVDRLLQSPKLEQGTRAFFSDMLHLERYSTVTKDAQLFPKFSQSVANAAEEQTLKTIVNQLLDNDGDYRELMTTRKTYMNRPLAAVYRVPFLADEDWMEYTFPEDSGQSGLLTQMSLAAVFSHPGRSSPTLRGVGINEIFLCNPTPLPPANVDFSIINDTNNPDLKTSRLRLQAHAEDPACSGCHRMIDPLGMALEHFDAMAQPRLYENGELIDVKVDFLGTSFEGSRGLGNVLYNNKQVQSCLVRNVYAYGIGRAPTTTEKNTYLAKQTELFAKDGYRFKQLLSRIASSEPFFQVPETDIITKKLQEQHVNLIAGEL